MTPAKPEDQLSDQEIARITEAAPAVGYTIVAKRDSGAAGVVFLAKDPAGNPVAIKLLRGPYEPNWLGRFRREAEILSRLNHRHVVRVLPPGVVWIADYVGYAMEFVEGISLRKMIATQGVLTEQDMLRLLIPVGRALAYIHESRVIHRDLHAGNILLDENALDRPKIVDFGTARDYSLDDLVDGQNYRTFRPIGSMSHCAPEKWTSPHEAGPESDVFSLGVMAYNAVTGEFPFWEDTYIGLYRSILAGQHTRARELRPEISGGFDELLEGMLESSNVFRIASVDEIVSECERLSRKK